MEDGFMKTWQECCDYFSVNTERGLSQDQVKKAKEKYGPNGNYRHFTKDFVKIDIFTVWPEPI